MPNHRSPRRRTRLELGSGCGEQPASSSAHGVRGSPDPPWPYGEHRSRGELGKRCIPDQRRIGAEVCSPSTVSVRRMQLPEASLVPFRRSALGGSLPSWLSVGCWGQCKQGVFMPNHHSPRRRIRLEVGSGCRDHLPSSRAHGAIGSPDPPWTYGEHRARGELGNRCSPEQSRIGAEVCSPSTVSLSRMHLPKASLVPFLSQALGGSLPSWLRLGCSGLSKLGLFMPNQNSP